MIRIGRLLLTVIALIGVRCAAFANEAGLLSTVVAASPNPQATNLHNASAASPPVAARPPGAPSRIDYSLSVSSAYPFSDVGYNVTALRGTVQGELGYQIDPLTKVQAAAYQFPTGLVGLNGTAPLYVRGNPAQIGTVHLPSTNPSAIFKIGALTLNRTVFVDHHPIIITPGYLFSYFEYDDAHTIEGNGRAEAIKARSFQTNFVALTIPLILNRRFVAFTSVSSEWLVHPNGLNQTNHPQLQLVGYAEYFANQHTSFFFEPSRFIDYQAQDRYPEYSFLAIYGINYRFTKQFFAQVQISSLNPTNYRSTGVANVTCSTPACTSALPSLGSIKGTTLLLSIGIGKPLVAPI